SSQGGEEQAADDGAAQGCVLLAAFAEAYSHGHHADDHCQCGHDYGTHAHEARLESRVGGAPPFVQLLSRKGNHQDAVRGSHTHTHDSAGKRRNAQGCVGEQEHPTDPRQRAGQGRDDDEGIQPGLEIDDDEQIGKNDGADQSNAEAHERGVHGLDLAADEYAAAARKLLLDIVHELCDFGSQRAEIASIDGGIHIDHRLYIVVGDGSRTRDRGSVHQIAEELRGRAGKAAVDGSVLESLVIIHAVLGRLDGNGVADTVSGIEPEVRRGLETRGERDQHVLSDVAGLQTHVLGARAIDVHEQGGCVKGLLDVDIHGPRHVADFVGELQSDGIIGGLIHAGNLDINGSGRPEIENLGNDVRGLEEKLHAGKFAGEALAQFVDVLARGTAAFGLQLDKDFGVGRADSAGVAIGEIDAGIRQADVIKNGDEVAIGDGVADYRVDLIGEPGGLLNAQAGAGAHVQANLAGVHAGEEVAAQKENESRGEKAEGQETRGKKRAVVQGSGERTAIGTAETLESALKDLLVAAEETHPLASVLVGMVLVFRTQQVHRHRRHDGARPHVGGQHGEADGFGKRHEEVFGDAG